MSKTVDSFEGEGHADTREERVFQHLLEQIHAGEMPEGAKISESAIAAQLGVSRGPVREALRRLQGINLVSREPFLRARVLALTTADVVELLQMREALEGYACRLAAERMSDAALVALAESLEVARAKSLAGEAEETGKVTDFHEKIVEASGNQRIVNALRGDVYMLIRLYRRRSGAIGDRHATAFQEHWQILRAMRSRDGLLAESLMRSHIARATAQLEALLAAPPVPARSTTAA